MADAQAQSSDDYSRQAADVTKQRGEAAARISDPDRRRKFIARQGEEEKKGGGRADLSRLAKEAYDEKNRQAAGEYRKGGKVRRGGVQKLHKGERIRGRKVKRGRVRR